MGMLAATLLWLAAPAVAEAATEDDLLPPDEAFAFSATAAARSELLLDWDIADGYYVYRGRFRFQTDTPGVQLGEPQFPAGEIKEDEFFGVVETYEDRLEVFLPITADPAVTAVDLTVVLQGCNEPIGVCYPPHTQTATIALPEPVAGGLLSSGAGGGLASQLGLNEDGLLPPDEAFVAEAAAVESDTILARWLIADGYYLYRDKFSFRLENAPTANLGAPAMPEGVFKEDDEFFGPVVVYYDQVELEIPVRRQSSEARSVTLVMAYQGCNEPVGVCYPPLEKRVVIELPATGGIAPAADTGAIASEVQPVAEQDRIAATLASAGTWIIVATFFGFGLLLAFTPCVLPMVPILSGIIAGQDRMTTARGFRLSLAFVLAMAVTYTAAGVLAGLFGHNLQAAFQNRWILMGFAAVFVLLALSMFGFYELQLPGRWQTRLTELSNRQRGGSYIGVVVMGLLSALIVGPCVAAPLAGALIYIGQTGDAALGGLALFSMSLGMGVPLLAVGTSAARYLPRAGAWMQAVKAVFGVALLGVAIWLLERIVPPTVVMLMWGALLVMSAIYLGALDRLDPAASGWRRFFKGLGVLLLILGAVEIIGAAAGGRDWTRPLHGIGESAQRLAPDFTPVASLAELETELAVASQRGVPVLLDFYADWCVDCKRMERYVYPEPAVRAALEGVVLLKADVTENTPDHQALLRHFGLYGPPATLFFSARGDERRNYRLLGFVRADRFATHVRTALNRS